MGRPPPEVQDARNSGLDLVRGLAALSVMLAHFADTAWVLDPSTPTFSAGGLGVDAFFCLSGYLIVLTASRAPDRRSFALARFLRLYPTYLVCLLITTGWVLGLQISNFRVGPVDWLVNLTMLAQLFGFSGVDSVYWSLGYEVLFYLTIWIALPLIKRGHAPWLCAVHLASTPFMTELAAGVTTLFTIGVCLYALRHQTERFVSIPGLALVLLMIGAIILGNHLDVTLIGPVAVIIGLHLPVPRGVAAWMGAVSYPLYLLHNYIGRSLVQAEMPLGAFFAILFAVTAMVALAALVHQIVEVRLVRRIKRQLGLRPSAQPVPMTVSDPSKPSM